MPHLPRLKLCETCDQVSFVRGFSRDVRCAAPVPPEGRPCRSRQVRVVTLEDLNRDRRDLRAQVAELRTDVHRLGVEADERDEVIEDLRAQVRLLRDGFEALRRQVRGSD